MWFWIGLAIGIFLTIPLSAWFVRRSTRRERLLVQRALRAERLAELGTLTGGLAHEIKNPLSTIGLNVQLLSEDLEELAQKLPEDSEPREHVGRMVRRFGSLSRETESLRYTLEDFLRFASRMKLDRVPISVNKLADELADFFSAQAQAADVHMRTQLLANPDEVYADATLLKQALLNLMINAVQAMTAAREKGQPNGGANELIIRSERARTLGQDEVRLHVTDTGPGIAPEQKGKVFHPYFSTKRGGSGLGLPTSRRIIEEHGGRLTFYSEPGRGTDFVISLPVGPPPAIEPEKAESENAKSATQ